MKTLGFFIIVHLNSNNRRHGGEVFTKRLWQRLTTLSIPNYINFNPGIDIDITILDTGCNYPGFNNFINESLEKCSWLKYKKIPNIGAASCGIKYAMHGDPELMDQYKYFIFAVDDTVYIEENDWAKDIVTEYEYNCDLGQVGLMGRNMRTLKMFPDGVIHPGTCTQIPKIWGTKQLEFIPHVHQDWWMIDQMTLKDLSKVWYDPVCSQESMGYITKYENMDTLAVCNLGNTHFKNFHIGREIDTPIRITRLLNKDVMGYPRTNGEKIHVKGIF